MNQSTHAWLAVEAFRMIKRCAATEAGRKRRLDRLAVLLGQHIEDVVVAAWLPDSLIKDMTFGHVFKTSRYMGEQTARFTLGREAMRKCLAPAAFQRDGLLDSLPVEWWTVPYRVKDAGGHLPTRVAAVCQNARDMLKMGNKGIYELAGVKAPAGNAVIAGRLLFSTRDVAVMLWMLSHYIVDAHMPFHCDNRSLASTSSARNAHGRIEDLWGEQAPDLFRAAAVMSCTGDQILGAPMPAEGHFKDLGLGEEIPPLRNGGDPWKEAVYICRASFATSFALVPPDVAAVDDQVVGVSREDILANGFCGEERFWKLSRAIMHDAATSIAMFWQDVWWDFAKCGADA